MDEKLERMEDFFAARLAGYDRHMREAIEGAAAFYDYTASLLPRRPGARVLDLGCGTGLELEAYFQRNPGARVTGVDLSGPMLEALRRKLPDRDVTLLRGSYFDVPLGTRAFDAAVSVESLHHFPAAQKAGLYRRLRAALTDGGYFVLTDYFAADAAEEAAHFRELARLRAAQALPDGVLYHYDTPLTAAHEAEVLRQAGFSDVRLLRSWGATCTLLANG